MKKRRTAAAILCITGLFMILPVLLLALGLLLPEQYGETFLGEMKYKLERLKTASGKRLVFVGGSSIPFGLKCGLVEQYLPEYQAVDFGMYAHMGMVVMLDWAIAYAQDGDIFVIIPEQDADTLSCRFSGEDVWQAADGEPELLALLSAKRYEGLAAALPAFACKKLRWAVSGTPEPDGIYRRASFDAYGDLSAVRHGNILSGGVDTNTPIKFTEEMVTDEFIEELNNFAEKAKVRGASVLYHFPPMNLNALSRDSDVDGYFDYLADRLDFPILGDPHRCLMESGWFYDSNYHLNSSGAIVFTRTLIEDIKVYLRDTSPTDISLPPMPKPEAVTVDGDSTQASLFTAHRQDSGWVLDGLTEEGLDVETLILPILYEGEPVIGISQTLFDSSPLVQEVTVQPNIGELPDGLFRGCTRLRYLVLTGSPSDYAVGEGLRDGAEFIIRVPQEYLNDYRLNYYWQKYEPWLTSF